MSNKTIWTTLTLVIVMTVMLVLQFIAKPKACTKIPEKSDMKNGLVKCGKDLKRTPLTNVSPQKVLSKDDLVENKDSVLGSGTNQIAESVKVPLDSASTEAIAYIKTARSKLKDWKMPDDVVPTVEIQGKHAIVTFWDRRWIDGTDSYPGLDYYAEVFIDIETKTVLRVLEPPN